MLNLVNKYKLNRCISAGFTPPLAVVLKCEDAVRYAIFGTGFFLPGCLHRGKVFVQYIINRCCGHSRDSDMAVAGRSFGVMSSIHG